jgi:hypothetical protein
VSGIAAARTGSSRGQAGDRSRGAIVAAALVHSGSMHLAVSEAPSRLLLYGTLHVMVPL